MHIAAILAEIDCAYLRQCSLPTPFMVHGAHFVLTLTILMHASNISY
jgi:hypothetical protein